MLLYAAYAGFMIYFSSVVHEGRRWFCLLDDAMISMRYARNLADGLGLVWNAGERVEGITNPGWTFVMALVHLFEPDRAHTSLYMQIISALCLMGTVWLTARLAWRMSGGSLAVCGCAAAATAFYYPLNYFSLYGMETGILALILTGAVALYIRQTDRGRFPWGTYLVLGFATIVRVDMAVPLLVVGGYGMVTADDRRNLLRHAVWTVATLLVFVGGQTAARMVYYGYPFPNTYYLKMTGFPPLQRIARGFYVTVPALWYLLWPVIAVGLAIVLRYAIQKRQFKLPVTSFGRVKAQAFAAHPILLPLFIFFGQSAYSIYVGGDAWEENIHCNRYMIIAVPLLFVAVGVALIGGIKRILPNSNDAGRDHRVAYFLGVAAYLVLINVFSVHPNLRRQIFPVSSPTVHNESLASIATATRIMESTPINAVISCDWAGAVPYFINRYAVDPLGKCDVHISHLSVPKSHWASRVWYKAFYPGHMKWDPEYTFSTYQPDVMVFFWGARIGVAFKPILQAHYSNESISGHGGAYFVRR